MTVTDLSPEPVFELTDVSRVYRQGANEIRAVDSVSFRIDPGEFVVVAGPSGSGKTTLLQLLGALDRPSGGEILVEGRNLSELGDGELTELRLRTIGFVFQQFNLIPTLTARENVELALAPAGLRGAARQDAAAALLKIVGLAERGDHLPGQLSGGEQQRVAIARALANEPDVLLADEPTGNLDSTTGGEIVAFLRSLAGEHGQTVVLITHDPAIAAQAPRVLRMQDGRLVEAEQSTAANAAS